MTPGMGVYAESKEGQDMALALEDRLAITELIALHGHLVDEGELDRCQEVFTPDVVYTCPTSRRGRSPGSPP
jgi:hypothetical protein